METTPIKTVSIAIPAYNEEKNIGHLIRDILSQEMRNAVLEKIIIYSDGSTDATNEIVRSVSDKRIVLIESKERKGLAHATNMLFRAATSDALVFLDADIAIKDQLFLEKIAKPVIDGVADLVSCHLQPLWPATFFEKVLYASFEYKNSVFENYHHGQNLFTCHGPARAFSKKLYSSMHIKEGAPTDAYSYFYALKNGFYYQFIRDAVIYIRLPDSFVDYSRQSVRFFRSLGLFTDEFGKSFVEEHGRLPKKELIYRFPFIFLRHPIMLFCYSVIVFISWIQSFFLPHAAATSIWEIAVSSKVVEKTACRRTVKEFLFIFFRRVVYASFGFMRAFIPEDRTTVFILCYHAVASDAWKYSIDPETLKRQIDYLLKTRKPVTVQDVELHIKGIQPITEPSFAVTFDDGYKDVLSVRDFMKSRGITPALFVLSDTEHANRRELETDRAFLSAQDLQELKQAGWEIGCHSATHADFLLLTPASLRREIVEAKGKLEGIIGAPVSYFAYPKGRYTDAAFRSVQEAGYALAFATNDGFIDTKTDAASVPRVNVDRTHAFYEFKGIATSPAILLRRFLRTRNIL